VSPLNDSANTLLDARAARIVLLVAMAAFVVQGWLYAGAQMSWHEEIATHAAPPPLQLVLNDGKAQIVDACAGDAWIAFAGTRPQLVLCVGGLAWPIMVTPYIGGIPYWPLQLLRPLHHGHPVAMRRAALLVGVFALWILFRLVERLSTSTTAAAAVAVAAVQPAFVSIHSLLVLFESLPSLLIACAALVIASRADRSLPPTTRRAAVAGALTGLAVLANVKGAVVALPILAFALFESPSLRRTSGRAWLAAGLMALLVLAPMIVTGLADPQARFNSEVGRRFAIAASRLQPRLLAAETLNSFVFAADFPFYFDLVVGGDGGFQPALVVVAGFAFFYSVYELVRALRRQAHEPVAAACGALQLFYVVFVCLAYNQTPGANYSPIIYAQIVSMGCAILAVGRAFARWANRPRLGIALMGAATVATLVINMYRRGDPRDIGAIALNLYAVEGLGEHLRSTPGGLVAVTSETLSQVPDALSGHASVCIDQALTQCSNGPDAEACELRVVTAVLDAVPNVRFLVPLLVGVVDRAPSHRIVATIEAAARARGASVREEGRFSTRAGVPALAVLDVVPGGAAQPS